MGAEIVPIDEAKPTSRRTKIRKLIAKGYTVERVVAVLSGGDELRAKTIRFQINKMLADDQATQLALAQGAKGSLIGDMPEIAEAVGRRAKKGNIPAAKLAMEASGFWSPRSQVEHTGEVAVVLKGVVRPAVTEDSSEATVSDAVVIEE